MILFKEPAALTKFLSSKPVKEIGFVPTMGALHEGHLALLKRAKEENPLVVVSVFVNPAQFNDAKDFEKYPHTIERDVLLLEKSGCDVLLLPSVSTIYPDGFNSVALYPIGELEDLLEGKFRPGHFQGVCRVMHRLLDIVRPGSLYMGQKDFQQCMVVQRFLTIIGSDTRLVICPTLREPDGLAMSSRNVRLNAEERTKAAGIYQVLNAIKKKFNENNRSIESSALDELKAEGKRSLTQQGFKVDYVEIVDAARLEKLSTVKPGDTPVALVAAFLNQVRLIDNMYLAQLN